MELIHHKTRLWAHGKAEARGAWAHSGYRALLSKDTSVIHRIHGTERNRQISSKQPTRNQVKQQEL